MKAENGNLCCFLNALVQAYNYALLSSQEPSWPWFDVEMTSTDKALLLKAQPIAIFTIQPPRNLPRTSVYIAIAYFDKTPIDLLFSH